MDELQISRPTFVRRCWAFAKTGLARTDCANFCEKPREVPHDHAALGRLLSANSVGWRSGQPVVIDGFRHLRILQELKAIVASQPLFFVFLDAEEGVRRPAVLNG